MTSPQSPAPPPQQQPSAYPANWYPDPAGRHELRFWDGERWTDHVSSQGRQGVDPLQSPPPPVQVGHSPERIQQQVANHQAQAAKRGGPVDAAFVGDGTLFGEPVLVVNQKAKLIEVNNEYAIFDQSGRQIGAVRQVGQSTLKKVMRVATNLDQFMTHTFQIVDAAGTVVMQVTRPAKLVKSKVLIADGAGRPIGEIRQENAIGKIRFGLFSGDFRLGSIRAENWRAWNFSIQDADDHEVARITKTWEGLAKTLFTTADNYVLQIHRPLPDPLRALVVASALTVDTALKQDSRGLG